MIRLRVSTNGLRTIEHKGGLDAYLLATADAGLETDMRKVKHQVEKAVANRSVA
jgi:large subunit ribosomal protein L28